MLLALLGTEIPELVLVLPLTGVFIFSRFVLWILDKYFYCLLDTSLGNLTATSNPARPTLKLWILHCKLTLLAAFTISGATTTLWVSQAKLFFFFKPASLKWLLTSFSHVESSSSKYTPAYSPHGLHVLPTSQLLNEAYTPYLILWPVLASASPLELLVSFTLL